MNINVPVLLDILLKMEGVFLVVQLENHVNVHKVGITTHQVVENATYWTYQVVYLVINKPINAIDVFQELL